MERKKDMSQAFGDGRCEQCGGVREREGKVVTVKFGGIEFETMWWGYCAVCDSTLCEGCLALHRDGEHRVERLFPTNYRQLRKVLVP
jgi:hypothetical protein